MMKTKPYLEQRETWPAAGKWIMAHYDEETVVVYQAYNPRIASYAVKHGQFGGEFSYSRMSWIKPNFLWMMYRAGWAAKPDQERILAVHLRRDIFDSWLATAVPSTFDGDLFATEADWKEAIAASEVRLQWDPDHDPFGAKQERRALQIGLRDEALACYGREAIRQILDITPFVHAQHKLILDGRLDELEIPEEHPYFPPPTIAKRIGL